MMHDHGCPTGPDDASSPGEHARRTHSVSLLRGALLALALLASSAPAAAQRLGVQRYSPASSADGVLGTEGAEMRRNLDVYAALSAHYALDPAVVRGPSGDESSLVRHLLAADVVASMHIARGLELGLLVPVALHHDGTDAAAGQAGIAAPSGAAFGDLQLKVAYRIPLGVRAGLALHVPLLLPTSQGDDVLSNGLGVRPTAAFQYGFDRADLLFNVSYLVRERVDVLDHSAGQELGARIAARVALDEGWNTGLLAELGFSTGSRDFFGASTSPVEGRVGLEHWLGPRWRSDVIRPRLTAFVGTGLSRGLGAPDVRAGVGIALGYKPYRPRLHRKPGDRDGDGIPDDIDQCPDDPEELDGYGDGDGCPDHIIVEDGQIVTFDRIEFHTGSSEIRAESHGMLREIAAVMRAHPSMRVRIEGHADSSGDAEVNRELSRQRAESVKRFLVGRGVDEDRLESVGHGPDRPISTNDTPEGRKQNRRVEFHISDF